MEKSTLAPVRVAVRVRPLLPSPPTISATNATTTTRQPPPPQQRPSLHRRSPAKSAPSYSSTTTTTTSAVTCYPETNQILLGRDRRFVFDHALPPFVKQKEVFDRCVSPMIVDGFFRGFNATVFAYGQTSSGKTYTMDGRDSLASDKEEDDDDDDDDDERGVVPRAIDAIFRRLTDSTGSESEIRNRPSRWRIFVSFVEIYLENLRDLLDLEMGKEIHIREDDAGHTVVCGAVERQCETKDEVLRCLRNGAAIRHTGATNMNELSSRSHTVFTITLDQRVDDGGGGGGGDHGNRKTGGLYFGTSTGTWLTSKFHFVDLAGSERVSRTGNVGERFKESIHINTGLLALGNVISALSNAANDAAGGGTTTSSSASKPHVPYRESKITRILKDSLGGNSLTLMICCVSPSSSDFDETLNSLRFAERAKKINNNPVINAVSVDDQNERRRGELEKLVEEVHRLKAQLRDTRNNATKNGDDDEIIRNQGENVDKRNEALQSTVDRQGEMLGEARRHLMDAKKRGRLTESLNGRVHDWVATFDNRLDDGNSSVSRRNHDDDDDDDDDAYHLKTEVSRLREELKEANERNQQMASRLAMEAVPSSSRSSVTTARRHSNASRRGSRPGSSLSIFVNGESEEAESSKVVLGGKEAIQCQQQQQQKHQRVVTAMSEIMAAFREKTREMKRLADGEADKFRVIMPPDLLIEEVKKASEFEESVRKAKSDNDDQITPIASAVPSKSAGPRVAAGIRQQTWTQSEDDYNDNNDPALTTSSSSSKSTPRVRFQNVADDDDDDVRVDAGLLDHVRSSTNLAKKRVRTSKSDIVGAEQKVQDLTLTIKMKEGLIRELVKSGMETRAVNEDVLTRMKVLEEEKARAVGELAETTSAFEKKMRECQSGDASEDELQRKLREAETKFVEAEEKLRGVESLVKFGQVAEKRANELEAGVKKLKWQHENAVKKLREEQERKNKLERDLAKEQQQLRNLETRFEQQQKVLKRKSEEAMMMRKKKNGGGGGGGEKEEDPALQQKQFMEDEMEKLLTQRQELDKLAAELSSRDAMLRRREAIVADKQALIDGERNDDGATRGNNSSTGSLLDEKQTLHSQREDLRKERRILDDRLLRGSFIGVEDERRLIMLDEALEALDAAIAHKSQNIDELKRSVRAADAVVRQSQAALLDKFRSLTSGRPVGADAGCSGGSSAGIGSGALLLGQFFDKVVTLKQAQKEMVLQNEGLKTRLEEKERVVEELKRALEKTAIEADVKATRLETRHVTQLRQFIEASNATVAEAAAAASSRRKKDARPEKAPVYAISNAGAGQAAGKRKETIANRLAQMQIDGGAEKRSSTAPASGVSNVGEGEAVGKRKQTSANRFAQMQINGAEKRSSTSTKSGGEMSGQRGEEGRSNGPSQRTMASASARQHVSAPARQISSEMDKLNPGHVVAPLRISRKEVRVVTPEEMSLRKSDSLKEKNETREIMANSTIAKINPWVNK